MAEGSSHVLVVFPQEGRLGGIGDLPEVDPRAVLGLDDRANRIVVDENDRCLPQAATLARIDRCANPEEFHMHLQAGPQTMFGA